MASVVERSIEVEVPASAAYEAWTRFELFRFFLQDVESVEPRGDERLHWRAIVAGRPREWEAEITERVPGARIAWRADTGAPSAGVVTVDRLGDSRSRVGLQLEYPRRGLLGRLASWLGVPGRRVRADLRRFKSFVEERGDRMPGSGGAAGRTS